MEGSRREEGPGQGSLRRRLPGPGPAQALSGPCSPGGPDTAQARRKPPHGAGDPGHVEVWLAHLAHVEFCIRVREAGELPGAAVEVDIAGPKGGQEAQMVVHWGTEAGSEGLAQGAL